MAKTLSVRTLNFNAYTIQVEDDYRIPPMQPGAWVEFQAKSGDRLSVYANNIEAITVGSVTVAQGG